MIKNPGDHRDLFQTQVAWPGKEAQGDGQYNGVTEQVIQPDWFAFTFKLGEHSVCSLKYTHTHIHIYRHTFL